MYIYKHIYIFIYIYIPNKHWVCSLPSFISVVLLSFLSVDLLCIESRSALGLAWATMSPWWDRAQSISTAAELDAWMMILPARSRPPWIAAILQAANSPCTGPARTWFLCKTLCLCITRFLCKTALCGKDGFDAKTSVLFKPWFKFKPKYVCKLFEDVRHKGQWVKCWI